jgi:hypothetical protein
VLAVPPKCAVSQSCPSLVSIVGIGFDSMPAGPNRHILPVTRSSITFEDDTFPREYRSGLVRLLRRIAAKITSAPSLNCVLVIATR